MEKPFLEDEKQSNPELVARKEKARVLSRWMRTTAAATDLEAIVYAGQNQDQIFTWTMRVCVVTESALDGRTRTLNSAILLLPNPELAPH